MSVPFFERGIVPGGNREIEREAVLPVVRFPRRGLVFARSTSLALPVEEGVASMKNRGQGGRKEKGDERRVKRKPETKRQRRIKKNGGDKGK